MNDREQPKAVPDLGAFSQQIIRCYSRAIRRWLPGQPISEAAGQRVLQAVRRFWRMTEAVKVGTVTIRTAADDAKSRSQLVAAVPVAKQFYDVLNDLTETAFDAAQGQFPLHRLMVDYDLERLPDALKAAAEEVPTRVPGAGRPSSQPLIARKIARSVIEDFEAITQRQAPAADMPAGKADKAWGLRALVESVFKAMDLDCDARTAYEAALENRAK
jgi:hypothetical protein